MHMLPGETDSNDFPAIGAFQPANRGMSDGFVVKLDADGSALDYATYLGGSDQDSIVSLALDDAGDVHVTGLSFSTNSPVTVGALQTSSSGLADALVAKITPGSPPPVVTSVSAASFDGAFGLASESIASGFGDGLAGETAVATSLPLADSTGGHERPCHRQYRRLSARASVFRFAGTDQLSNARGNSGRARQGVRGNEWSGSVFWEPFRSIQSRRLCSPRTPAAKDRPLPYSYVLTQTALTLRCGPLIQIRELRFRSILARKVTRSSCFCSEQAFVGLLRRSGRKSAEKAFRFWAPCPKDSSLGSTK